LQFEGEHNSLYLVKNGLLDVANDNAYDDDEEDPFTLKDSS